jgi:hypothetical protein
MTYRLEAVDEEGGSDGLVSLVPLFVLLNMKRRFEQRIETP